MILSDFRPLYWNKVGCFSCYYSNVTNVTAHFELFQLPPDAAGMTSQQRTALQASCWTLLWLVWSVVCVCVCVCMRIRAHVYELHICVCVHAHTCTCVWTTYLCVCVHAHTCTCVWTTYLCVCVCVHAHTCTCVWTTYLCVCVCVCEREREKELYGTVLLPCPNLSTSLAQRKMD